MAVLATGPQRQDKQHIARRRTSLSQKENTVDVRDHINTRKAPTIEDQQQFVRERLAEYAGQHYGADQIIARHTGEPKNKISLPENMEAEVAAKQLQEHIAEQQEHKVFNKTFKYRPWDGGVALQEVLKANFGSAGRQLPRQTFFGPQPPEEREVEIAYGETVSIPWGDITFAPLEGTLTTGATVHPDYGLLFQLSVYCPKKYAASVQGLFKMIEDYLREHSIYKGKAIRGTDEPRFLDLETDPSIVFNQDVYDTLQNVVWDVISDPDLARLIRVKVDPKVLLEGPFGTGKSETGRITARHAVENGWTFISFNSAQSLADLEKTIQTARLLAPAVVFVEDIDKFAKQTDDASVSRMLEMFDGISSKNQEVMILMTSNDLDAFSPGMLRSGRIDTLIHVGLLDREATERLMRKVCGDTLGTVDFDEVYEALKDFEPSFMRSVFDTARQTAAFRTRRELVAAGTYTGPEQATKFLLTTEDFVTAAALRRPQWKLHQDAKGKHPEPTFREWLDQQLQPIVEKVMTEHLTFTNSQIGGIDVEVVDIAERS